MGSYEQKYKSIANVIQGRPKCSTVQWKHRRLFQNNIGCLPSQTINSTFWERIIMLLAQDDHQGSVSTGGRIITSLRLAVDIIVNAKAKEEADIVVDRLDRTTTRYQMETGSDKTKVMTNNPNGSHIEIKIKVQRFEAAEIFKYLETIISGERSMLIFFLGLTRQQQIYLDWRSYGETILNTT